MEIKEKDIIELLRRISLKDERFPSGAQAEVWNNISRMIQDRKRKRAGRRLYVVWGTVASVAVLVYLTLRIALPVEVESVGKSVNILLPDGSTVELVAHSSLRYNKIVWYFDRSLELKGDATFEVTKGQKFKVATQVGNITVLGTRFFVSQKETNLHVACFEGSVRVDTPLGNEILLPNEQLNCNSSGMQRSEIKKVLPEFLEYDNTPLINIVQKIEETYGVRIVNRELCRNLSFSGLVSTGNLNEAIEIVFGVCDLKFRLEGDIIILTESKP